VLSRLIVRYDHERYPFGPIVAEHLGIPDLSMLHETYSYSLFTRTHDQNTDLHRKLYSIGERFFQTYRLFLHEQVRHMVGDDIVFQKIPNFRFQLPSNVGVGAFHRDRDNNHSPNEINFWVPLTPVTRTTAVWLESAEGRRDYSPCLLQYGEMLVFDGANLEHGNKLNQSGRTRVSFDFRVVPAGIYEDNVAETVVMKQRLVVGEYFEHLGPAITHHGMNRNPRTLQTTARSTEEGLEDGIRR